MPSPATKRRRLASEVADATTTEWAHGSIRRIRLQNFMTYDDIEYVPGAALNMIIGPNGSGKSSVVAGICIGLGFDAKIMGRASSLQDTIKHGTSSARIEVDLQGESPDETIAIAHQYSHGDGGSRGPSEWFLDGKHTTKRQIGAIVKHARIQIDNLCQFLPQDKVASFARMTPVELLTETLRTVTDGSLAVRHNTLVELQQGVRASTARTATTEETLKGLQQRQEVLARDVERFKDVELLKKEIAVREHRLPYIRYETARCQLEALKEEYRTARADLSTLRKRTEPLDAQAAAIAEVVTKADKTSSRLKNEFDKALGQVNAAIRPLQTAEETVRDLNDKWKAENEAEQRAKNRLVELRELVARDARNLGTKPDHEAEINSLTDALRAINDRTRDDKEQLRLLGEELRRASADRRQNETRLEQLKRQMDALSDVREQRMEQLRRRSPDAAKAVDWLNDNRDKFEHQVFDPVLLEVQVTDPTYSVAAQHIIMQSAFTFTCQSRKDFNTFNEYLVDGRAHRLRLHVVEYSRTVAPTLTDQRALISKEEVKQFGFDGFLLDRLDGPPPVLNTLCHTANVHTIPVGVRPLSVEQQQRIEAAQVNGRAVFMRYISADTDTKIARAYGQVSTTAETMNNDGKVFSLSVDVQRRNELQSEIDGITDGMNEQVAGLRQKEARRKELAARDEEVEREKEVNRKKKAARIDEVRNWERANVKVQTRARELQDLEEKPAPYQENIAAIKSELRTKTQQYTDLAVELCDKLQLAQHLRERHVVAAAASIQAKANQQAFGVHNSALHQEIRQTEERYDQARRQKKEVTDKAKALHAGILTMLETLAPDVRAAVEAMDAGLTEQDLELEIADRRNRMRLLDDIDGNVLETFEQRAAQIAALEGELESQQAAQEAATEELAALAEDWTTEVEDMRAKLDVNFSEAFQSIDCVGEIRLGKADLYEKWTLEIWVQFRDEDSLQLLTGQRQSGGERSVSTIFFLMALQALTTVPFRVVDEINQGMDPRNERMVHRRMVQVACARKSSQYFLITPKLLNDLDYHPSMKIHCVTNGNLGARTNKIDNERYLAALRTLRDNQRHEGIAV